MERNVALHRLLAATLCRLDEAARHLEDAAAINAAIGARPWIAHAKADHARVLLTRQAPGDRESASDSCARPSQSKSSSE